MTVTLAEHVPEGKMKAVEWHGNKDIRVNDARLKPKITDPLDAIVRITGTSISGTDLHLYHKTIPGIEKRDILGHEAIGIVDAVGPLLNKIAVGDRVVVSSIIADGTCPYCTESGNLMTSLCEHTYPGICPTNKQISEEKKEIYSGSKAAGLFGYSYVCGGIQGTQAQFMRVPCADFNLLKIPSDVAVLSDENALLLSDALCTAWHGTELGTVGPQDNLAIWGAGPIGILTAYLAKQVRGVNNVIIIDGSQDRLNFATKYVPNIQALNYNDSKDVAAAIRTFGPSVTVDCVGFRYSKSWLHSIEKSLGTTDIDSIESINEAINSIGKSGRVIILGEYIGKADHFPIGQFVEKNLTLKGGRAFVHKYWPKLLQMLLDKEIDPSFIVTHKIPLEAAPNAYSLFDKKEEGVIKVLMKPDLTLL